MRKIKGYIFIVLAILLSSCGNTNEEQIGAKLETEVISKNNCGNEQLFGTTKICLPSIDGMKECYSQSKVKEAFPQHDANQILGVYIDEESYSQIDNLPEISYKESFKIYAQKSAKGKFISTSILDELAQNMLANFSDAKWADLKQDVDGYFDNVSFGQPVLIESYKLNKKIRSMVFLMKNKIDNNEFIIVGTLSMVLIKNRIVNYAYYLDYEGEQSIKNAKAKSDYFGFKFINNN